MSPNHRKRGFSLIEVMVVLVIIGIATAAISVNISAKPSDTLRLDARELAQRLTAAQNEVRLDGRVIAWQSLGEGYRFTRGVWVSVPGSVVPALSTAGALDLFERDDVLRPRQWRAGAVDVMPSRPLLLTSEWIGSPLRLELRSGNNKVVLERDATGAFVVP
ncbi:prepilin-type N-terminal cleavage/methylation domain-containing protein [Comamonas sp. GB3 AK4-5]|uniref:prepilin-type N-terminal cleavage/methylation domain-containing protein n=1 Tax=Comamonas sp. GB3 AK4-5 TaxID=3231487 RepID=UPI00351EDA2A